MKDQKKITVIKTIGHSTRSIDDFLTMLRAFNVHKLVDIRKMPRSRANPQFNMEALEKSLSEAGVFYKHMPGLTGLRKQAPHSQNNAWRNKSFQAFADYMQTAEFAQALDELLDLADGDDTAIMCAEAVPWRCHRSLIGDALVARGIAVVDLMSNTKAVTHFMPDFAKVAGSRVTYPACC